MAESEITAKLTTPTSENDPKTKQPKNPFSLFPKIELKLPFFNQNQVKKPDFVAKEESRTTSVDDGEGKPNVVRYPNAQPVIPGPIEAEAEENGCRTHDPFIIWQVYAVGGFMILRWIWERWNERKERAKKKNDGSPPADEYQSPTDED